VILYRDGGNRTGFNNTGNESVFVVANQSGAPLQFSNPVVNEDPADDTVTLDTLQFAAYVRDNATGAFLEARGPTAFGDGNGTAEGLGALNRFSIGNSSNGKLGTFSLDNVAVVDEVSFQTQVPEPASLSLLGGAGLAMLARRRRR